MSYSPVYRSYRKNLYCAVNASSTGKRTVTKREALKFPYHLPQDASWQAGKIALTVPAG
ncbi:MAG: hypothetical protein HC786_07965 [Richelia sp. CSU_2_1]|nr:hypothetical protein [Microcoleus sp. SU_5_3]NJR22096.1 hypothetical protein [Richelia sp. CSU_2_1]